MLLLAAAAAAAAAVSCTRFSRRCRASFATWSATRRLRSWRTCSFGPPPRRPPSRRRSCSSSSAPRATRAGAFPQPRRRVLASERRNGTSTLRPRPTQDARPVVHASQEEERREAPERRRRRRRQRRGFVCATPPAAAASYSGRSPSSVRRKRRRSSSRPCGRTELTSRASASRTRSRSSPFAWVK